MLLIKNSQHMGREVRRSISRILSTWELGGKIRESGSLGAWESKARELSRRRGKSPCSGSERGKSSTKLDFGAAWRRRAC